MDGINWYIPSRKRHQARYIKKLKNMSRQGGHYTLLIYSMWDGYLYQENNPIGTVIKEFKNVEHLHTSGHATKQTIIDVCNTVKPQKGIIPIHIENPELMNNLHLGLPIVILNDREKFTI